MNKSRNKKSKIDPKKLRRFDWHEMFMNVANIAAHRTSCIFHKVGSVFVDGNHRIISIGYNGPSSGDVHCVEYGCAKIHGDPISGELKPCRGVHSEINAISNCHDINQLRGSTLYVTVHPCYNCMKSLVNVGVRKIIYLNEYRRVIPGTGEKPKTEIEPEAIDLAKRSGIIIEKFDLDQSVLIDIDKRAK